MAEVHIFLPYVKFTLYEQSNFTHNSCLLELNSNKLSAVSELRQASYKLIWIQAQIEAFVDGFKLLVKENVLPHKSNKIIFVASAVIIFGISLLG